MIIYILLTIRKSPKALYPLQENCNFCNRNHCNHLHCLLILSCEVQGIITFSQLLSENHIYTIALLNFSMNEDAFDKEKIRHHVQLCDTATVMEITGLSAEEILLLKREK